MGTRQLLTVLLAACFTNANGGAFAIDPVSSAMHEDGLYPDLV